MLEQKRAYRRDIHTDEEMKIYTPRCVDHRQQWTEFNCCSEQAPVRIYQKPVKSLSNTNAEQTAESGCLFF